MALLRVAGLTCLLALALASSAGAVPVLTVPGETERPVVDNGAAFLLRRTQHPFVVRVDLRTGRRTVVFRTDGIPGDILAAGGVLGFTVDVPGDPAGVTQLIAIPTANPAGGAVVLRAAPHPADDECSPFDLAGVTPTGELLVSTLSGRCGSADAKQVVSAIGPAGERVLSTAVRPDDPVVVAAAGPWELEASSARALRLVNVVTGATRTFRTTLSHARMEVHDLQPDGRFVLDETVPRRRGGYVQRTRVVSPTAGTRVLGTLGTPPRLNALFCGGRLVVSRTKDHRTRIVVGDDEIARVSTSFEPFEACDATRLVVATSAYGAAPTRLAVVPLAG